MWTSSRVVQGLEASSEVVSSDDDDDSPFGMSDVEIYEEKLGTAATPWENGDENLVAHAVQGGGGGEQGSSGAQGSRSAHGLDMGETVKRCVTVSEEHGVTRLLPWRRTDNGSSSEYTGDVLTCAQYPPCHLDC